MFKLFFIIWMGVNIIILVLNFYIRYLQSNLRESKYEKKLDKIQKKYHLPFRKAPDDGFLSDVSDFKIDSFSEGN